MSEAQNTVVETPVAAPVVTDVPAVEPATTEAATTSTTEAPVTETPETTAATTEAAKEESAKEEVTPATDGTLGYKGPGLVKSLRFAKRYFYFTEEATEPKNLIAFNTSEKSAGHSTSAWATQTGKGLLFFTKRAEDKATPAGIFNLAEISDLSKEGSTEFLFKLNGQKHVFQAASAAERDSWIAAVEAQTAVATSEKETITSSEGYKAELEKLAKPATAAIAAATVSKKSKDEKKEEAAAAPIAATTENDTKSRSRSRKRASIFGTILGKKDAEEKKETKEEAKEETPAEAATETPAATTEVAEPATTETTTEAPVPETTEVPATTEATEDKEEDPKKEATKSKRASIFGTLFQKVTSPSHEKSEKEATAPKDTTVASTAPQLENPVEEAATEPIEPEAVTAAADATADESPKETETASSPTSKARGFFSKKEKKAEKEEDTTAAPTESTPPKEKRRTSLFGTLGGKKEKKPETSDAEVTEGETKPKIKLGGLFRKPSKAVKSEEAPAETDATAEADKPEPISKDETVPAEATPAVNGETEAPTVPTTAPVVEATA